MVHTLTFSNTVLVRPTVSHHDYTDEERHATWYTQEECDHILLRRQKEISKLDRGIEFKDKKYCSRGLEHTTHEESQIRSYIISLSVQVVLEEQMEQRYQHGKKSMKAYDDVAIAEVYRQISAESEVLAHLIGLRDEKEADVKTSITNNADGTKKYQTNQKKQRNVLTATAA